MMTSRNSWLAPLFSSRPPHPNLPAPCLRRPVAPGRTAKSSPLGRSHPPPRLPFRPLWIHAVRQESPPRAFAHCASFISIPTTSPPSHNFPIAPALLQ
ncbi:hypothetical protein P691DRAFT_802912 [Macrolepiota fuliginosa MF-IS2]|uniref:Uncharacterized protein n=1 Tax=Macrolepiota fuliginosa MF-IS2 TaxID=1400762 RepID=A0A9P5WYM8_9AGAR|nr:hypothetical protein P691DRAFT_802912 [Macrolepiota fuliginosa MF-IS2]